MQRNSRYGWSKVLLIQRNSRYGWSKVLLIQRNSRYGWSKVLLIQRNSRYGWSKVLLIQHNSRYGWSKVLLIQRNSRYGWSPFEGSDYIFCVKVILRKPGISCGPLVRVDILSARTRGIAQMFVLAPVSRTENQGIEPDRT
jgi:hypothetical protein